MNKDTLTKKDLTLLKPLINDSNLNLEEYFLRLLEDKTLLNQVLDYYENQDLLLNIEKDVYSLNFKWNLAIMLLKALRKKKVDEKILALIEKDAYKEVRKSTAFDGFFESYRLGLNSLNKVMELITSAMEIERSGWLAVKVPTPHKESIAEHMYMMGSIAKNFLPNTIDYPTYSKQRVIDMCLIHDLGETLTGDIISPSKVSQDELEEDLKMKAICIALIYYGSECGLEYYSLWNEWYENQTINAALAHDFDHLQLDNQVLNYAIKYPELFSVSDLKLWFRRKPQTKMGKNIFEKLIKDNPKKCELYQKIKEEKQDEKEN